MCMYSVTAANSRDAAQGEDLVVTQATHGQSNWLTGGGKPNIAVCVPHTAVLAVQLPNQGVRGATFEQAQKEDAEGNRDFLNFLDGEKERMALNYVPKQTKIRVLHLRAANLNGTAPIIPTTIATNANDGELVGMSSGNPRGRLTRMFDSD